MKHFTMTLSLAVMLAMAGASVADAAAPAQRVKRARGERKALVAESPIKHIKGGSNGDKQLYGMIYEAYDGPFYEWQGPVAVSSTGSHKKLKDEVANATGCYFDGKFLCVDFNTYFTWSVYDATTWEVVGATVNYTTDSPYTLPNSMAYDHETETIYACMFENGYDVLDDKGSYFGSVNLSDMGEPVTILGDMGVAMRAMAVDKSGTLYGIGMDGGIYTINKFTADITKVCDIDLPRFEGDPNQPAFPGHESAVIDWETGDMYFSYWDSEWDAFIVKVDLSDGSTTMVGNYGYFSEGTETCEVFSALWFEQSAKTQAGTPAEVTDLTAVANGYELSATVEFTMPVTDIEGNALSGNVNWTVGDGNTEFANGSAAAGSRVKTTVAVPVAAMYNLVVTASVGSNAGKPVASLLFVGPDTPVINGLPAAIVGEDGMTVSLRWSVAESLNGGNLAEPLTYKVLRMPDNVVVAESVADNKFVDKVTSEIKTDYTYLITPKAGDVEGVAVTSRVAHAGVYFPMPHVYSFEKKQNEDIFNQYPTIDVDGDANDWFLHSSYGIACPGTTSGMDDYLLVGPFKLEAGALYTFSFTADGHSMIEYVEAYVGTDPADVPSVWP